jgi:hypothetical protein
MEEEILFYNSKTSQFEGISKEKEINILKKLSNEKNEVDKSISINNDLIFEYFPEFVPYIKNYPYMLKLIINKIREETEYLKKNIKNKINSNLSNSNFLNKTEVNQSFSSGYHNYSENFNSKNQKNNQNNPNQAENVLIVGNNLFLFFIIEI